MDSNSPTAAPEAPVMATLVVENGPETGGSIPRNPSRFQVNKVEGDNDTAPSVDTQVDSDPVLPPEPIHRGVHFKIGAEKDEQPRVSTEGGGTYSTANFKSFQAIQTVEKIPHLDHYRNIMSVQGAMATRPTLQQLHDEYPGGPRKSLDVHMQNFERFGQFEDEKGLKKADQFQNAIGQKFGWIQGVLMRCVLSILGTMLYLRISWVTGTAGIGFGTLIVLVSAVVVTITCISMCAICTNGEIRGGGAYYMISRSLGPEFGGSIGLIFSFANAVASAMCVVGFAEVVRDLIKNEFRLTIIDGEINDVRIISYATLGLLLCVVMIGVSFESKAQLILLVVLALSLIDYIIGTFIPPDDEKSAKGMTGYSMDTLKGNFYPYWNGESFFSVFAVFFPACTGIMAGANISGDLADPQKAIPKGTLLAIAICMLIYIGAIWTTGATFVREIITNSTSLGVSEGVNATGFTYEYGLLHNFQIMEISGAWRPLVTAGIFAATLSSALAAFVSAPKVFQAVCKDRLFPFIHVFGKGYGAGDEPRRGYILSFIIAIAVISIGTLNDIAPIISNFFLMSYALVNFACFDASFAGSPGFRPGFRYYNMWISLFGAVLCLAVMFIISWWNALITFGFVSALYVYVLHRKPDVNWGSSTQAHAYKSALQASLKVAYRQEHVKNYRPQLLLLTGNPVARPALVDFAANITKDNSLLVCGHVITTAPTSRVLLQIEKMSRRMYEWFERRKVKAFYVGVARHTFREGVQCILHVSGIGKLKPNVVLLGFKHNWAEKALLDQSNLEYFNIIHDSFENNCGVGILRVSGGLDISEMMSEHNVGDTQKLQLPEPTHAINIDAAGSTIQLTDSNRQLQNQDETRDSISSIPQKIITLDVDLKEDQLGASTLDLDADVDMDDKEGVEMKLLSGDDQVEKKESRGFRGRRMTKQQKEIVQIMNQFQIKAKKPILHVYWLFDDGGLGLLIPHLLTLPRSFLEGAKLNVFTVAASRSQLEKEQRSMAALLSRFRIEYSDVYVIADLAKKPQQTTIHEFEQFIAPFRKSSNEDQAYNDYGYISNAEYDALRAKTYRQLRIREILLQHSNDATFIVVTLPVPRKGILTSSLYLAWLDFMTRNLPTVLFLRGNQQSVLTFYS